MDGLEWYKDVWEATKSGYNTVVKKVDETTSQSKNYATQKYEEVKIDIPAKLTPSGIRLSDKIR